MSIQLSTLDSRLETLMGDSDDVYSSNRTAAINNAGRELYPILFRKLVDEDLVTGNILPPFIWASTSTLDVYTEPTGTLAKTTATYLRGATTSAKVTASGADDSIILDSNLFPRLLDVMDNTVSLKCWALPEVANDAFLDIITTDSDGSNTTESSTTACPAGVFTLLEIEDYAVPDDITRIRVKLRVHTTTKYAYFAAPRLTGKSVYELMLPQYFQDGHISQVWLQTSGYSDDACDDLHPRFDEGVFGWKIIDDGTYKYLRLPYLVGSLRKLRLIGYCPLEDDLSVDADTMTIDSERANLLLYQAAALIMQAWMGVVSRDDTSKYERQFVFYMSRVEQLKRQHRMARPVGQIHWSI